MIYQMRICRQDCALSWSAHSSPWKMGSVQNTRCLILLSMFLWNEILMTLYLSLAVFSDVCKVSRHKCSSLLQDGFDHSAQKLLQHSGRSRNIYRSCQMTAGFCLWGSLRKLTLVHCPKGMRSQHRQTYILKCICHCAICWVSSFFTPPLVLELEIQAGEMWKQLGLIHSCCYSFCFHWSYSKAEFSIWWTTCSPKLELRGEGFRDDHATLRLLLKQLKLPQEGQCTVSSGYWI